ncbi:MAG: PepSY-like domain-containing protein [Paludibacteraceae bacterium]|mgnify:FL=1|jgi:hypothetical protein|nr:PepSY-like domain-containing protein [Paludibacteraceae bacterium]OQA48791.1 MAG: hypothetical protein BWY47_00917 [Bacteroidetes bacterium ADurb.Bin302]HPG54793.1 PepSY-like domain-containing protein [Candidatus Enterocola sp.]
MKKALILLVCTSFFSFAAYADNEDMITTDQLPVVSQQFIKKYFPNETVAYAKYDPEFFDSAYEITFKSGNSIEFNKQGEWKDYECKTCIVPDELLPNEISSYIKEKYPDKNIVSIERGKKTYEVKLSNGLELKFNLRGQLLEIDL